LFPPLHTVLTSSTHPGPAWQIEHERVYSPCISIHMSTYVPPRVGKNFCKHLFSKQKKFPRYAPEPPGTSVGDQDSVNHTASLVARCGLPLAPCAPASSLSPACWRPSGVYPRPADGQEQEHTSQRGVDTHTRAQCAAPTAPAPTASLHGSGE